MDLAHAVFNLVFLGFQLYFICYGVYYRWMMANGYWLTNGNED